MSVYVRSRTFEVKIRKRRPIESEMREYKRAQWRDRGQLSVVVDAYKNVLNNMERRAVSLRSRISSN